MKSMEDKKLKMKRGKDSSDWYFPSESHVKEIKSCGEIKQDRYPDTEEDIYRHQEESIRKISRNEPREGYRH